MEVETRMQYELPALIVLVRGRPEEEVLVNCKTEAVGDYPGTTAQHCGQDTQKSCASCQSRGQGANS